MIKPDPAIYAHHTKAFGLEPAATLFFDNSPANIEAAREAGWNAELFTSAEKCARIWGGMGYGLRRIPAEGGREPPSAGRRLCGDRRCSSVIWSRKRALVCIGRLEWMC